MQTIVATILAVSAVFFLWFGYVVESGTHKPDPFDDYFPLPIRGYNIDYMIGVAGIAIGTGLAFLSASLFFSLGILAILGVVAFGFGIIRSLLPPDWVGPQWFHKRSKK